MTSTGFRQRLALAMLTRKSKRSLLEKGFTLVELMIVIVIVGILAAVALPSFLGARDKAKLGSQIGEASGLAKECATEIISGGTVTHSTPTSTGVAITGSACAPATTGNVTYTTDAATANTAGMKCGSVALAADRDCVVTVSKVTGVVTYTQAAAPG